MRKGDIVIIVVALLCAGGLYFSGFLKPKETGGEAVVYVEGKEAARYSLLVDGEYTVETAQGYNVIQITGGRAIVSAADCADKICVNHAPVSLVKESIVCLPHKLIVEIENTVESDIDAMVQ